MQPFLGFDHIDVRVRSLALVEQFYDRLMPELGLTNKTFAHVDSAGRWLDVTEATPYNTIEYHEPPAPGLTPHFIGFIEEPTLRPSATRIAFRVTSMNEVLGWEERLRVLGAHDIERDQDIDNYPAIFFADPAGTQLEICARRPKP